MQDPSNQNPNPNPNQPIPSNNSSSTTQKLPSFLNPTTYRGSYHRRAQSEVQFRVQDNMDLVSDPFEGLGSEDDPFSGYMDIENPGGGSSNSKGVDQGEGSGSGGYLNGGSGQNPISEGMGDGDGGGSGSGSGQNSRGRHRYSNSVDGGSLMESIEAKKAMDPDQLAELWTVDPKRAKRIIANRRSATRSKERKALYMTELERKVQTLQTEATTLSAHLTLFQRDTSGLAAENNELQFQLKAMEKQTQLSEALSEALKNEVESLKSVTGETTTPTDNFNLGMHHMSYNQSSFFAPQNMRMPPFHPYQSNLSTPNPSMVAASNSNSRAFADMMQQDHLGLMQGLDIGSKGST